MRVRRREKSSECGSRPLEGVRKSEKAYQSHPILPCTCDVHVSSIQMKVPGCATVLARSLEARTYWLGNLSPPPPIVSDSRCEVCRVGEERVEVGCCWRQQKGELRVWFGGLLQCSSRDWFIRAAIRRSWSWRFYITCSRRRARSPRREVRAQHSSTNCSRASHHHSTSPRRRLLQPHPSNCLQYPQSWRHCCSAPTSGPFPVSSPSLSAKLPSTTSAVALALSSSTDSRV